MTKSIDLNADYATVCKSCRKNAEKSADCAECVAYDANGPWICDGCDLNPNACSDCDFTVTNIRAQGIVSETSENPVVLLYNDVEYDDPIEFTVKRETDTMVSVDGWWALGDGLYGPINDETFEQRTFRIEDAVKRVETLLKMGAFIKP